MMYSTWLEPVDEVYRESGTHPGAGYVPRVPPEIVEVLRSQDRRCVTPHTQ